MCKSNSGGGISPFTFFSFIEEEKNKIIVYVSRLDSSALKTLNMVPSTVEGKQVLVHFEQSVSDKYVPQVIEESYSCSEEDEFVAEKLPIYGLNETLDELVRSDVYDPFDFGDASEEVSSAFANWKQSSVHPLDPKFSVYVDKA